jgi:hypothetical protein
MRYMVELEPGQWLPRKGRIRVSSRKEARVYSRWQDAKVGLTWAEKMNRPFPHARIVEIEVEDE